MPSEEDQPTSHGHRYKKLSYRRGTARRRMLVSSCYISRGMAVRKVSISERDLQGHGTGAIR